MAYKSYLPLITYQYAESADQYTSEDTRGVETRHRHWALVHWASKDGERNTAEVCVITEAMPDFCGGVIVHSPQVHLYHEKDDWSDNFCQEHAVPSELNIVTKWPDFEDTMAIDLQEFIPMEEYTFTAAGEVRNYLFECIAAHLSGFMIDSGKRGFVMADSLGGSCISLVSAMQSMGTFMATPNMWRSGSVTNVPTRCPDRTHTVLCQFWVDQGPDWYNVNSGNDVAWIQGGIKAGKGKGDEPEVFYCEYCQSSSTQEYNCPDCGEYYDEDERGETMPGATYKLKDTLKCINADYASRARRYYWRNG